MLQKSIKNLLRKKKNERRCFRTNTGTKEHMETHSEEKNPNNKPYNKKRQIAKNYYRGQRKRKKPKRASESSIYKTNNTRYGKHQPLIK